MKTLRLYSPNNSTVSDSSAVGSAMLCTASLVRTYLRAASLYLLTPFIHFPLSPNPLPQAPTNLTSFFSFLMRSCVCVCVCVCVCGFKFHV